MSSFILKIIALICMTIDHIGVLIPNMPIWFNWIGRISAPIFMFCAIESMVHTSDRKKYLFRLYIASVLMGILQFKLNIDMNFFRVIFSTMIIIYLVLLSQEKNLNIKNMILFYILWQVISICIIIALIYSDFTNIHFIIYILSALTGSVFYLEGGLVLVALGLMMFALRKSHKNMAIGYVIFCSIYFILSTTSIISRVVSKISRYNSWFGNSIEYILDTIVGLSPVLTGGDMWLYNYQWLMICALPFVLFYNNKKGGSLKYLFYVYYPLHISILYLVGKYYIVI